MSDDAWPAHDPRPHEVQDGALPRVEDLPVATGGYDQEAVRAAFDAFYRHAARLDASLRALDAVDAFRRDADALRNDLRAIRAAGVGAGLVEPAWTARTYERTPSAATGVAVRLAAESVLIIAVAVIAGIGHLRTPVIVALMAGAFVVVAFSEWLASRSRFVSPAALHATPQLPLPAVAAAATSPPDADWGRPAGRAEDTPPEELTVIAAPIAPQGANGDAAAAGQPDPWEQGPDVGAEAAPETEIPADEAAPVEPAVRGGLFRRRR